MEIPVTTPLKPYIEFRFDKNGKMKLSATASWWGGKNSGFGSGDGSEGNSCKPEHLNAYIKAFKERQIKNVEKEIAALQKKLAVIKLKYESINVNIKQ
jgi:hypothetical protein